MPTGLDDFQVERVRAVLEAESESRRRRALARLGSPEELYQLAWNWNWDDGCAVPRWIIRHPLCDRGTALRVYWTAAPGWYRQYSDRHEMEVGRSYELDGYDLVKEIEERLLAGAYGHSDI